MLGHFNKPAMALTSVLVLMLSLNIAREKATLAQIPNNRMENTFSQSAPFQHAAYFQRAQEELPKQMYLLYRTIDRIARANRLDIPYWRVEIEAESSPLAYIKPGFVIVVSEGMIDLLEDDESASACILAHEMTHHVREHMPQFLSLVEKYRKLIADAENIEEKIRVAREAERHLEQLSHNFELEADQGAYRYSLYAGYDPNGCMRGLKLLGKVYGSSSSSTHPAWVARLQAMESLKEEYTPQKAKRLRQRGSIWLEMSQPSSYKLYSERSLKVKPESQRILAQPIDSPESIR